MKFQCISSSFVKFILLLFFISLLLNAYNKSIKTVFRYQKYFHIISVYHKPNKF